MDICTVTSLHISLSNCLKLFDDDPREPKYVKGKVRPRTGHEGPKGE